MCPERMCYIEIEVLSFFFFPWGDQYFIVQSVFLCQSNSFLIAPPHFCVILHRHWCTLSACPYAHSSKIYLTPHWPTLSIYFDLFAHLILVPLSCSVLSFQDFVTRYSLLLSVLGSLWDSRTMFSLSISSWIFLEIEAHNFCLQYFYPQHCVISSSHSEKL